MALTKEMERDVRKLSALLQCIDRLFGWLMREALPAAGRNRRSLAPDNIARTVELMQAALPGMSARIADARNTLAQIQDESSPTWRHLSLAGLTGQDLRWKSSLLDWLLTKRRPLKRLLQWVNNFLGSLSTAIPGIEAVKEFKEGIELVIERQGDLPDLPRRIFEDREG